MMERVIATILFQLMIVSFAYSQSKDFEVKASAGNTFKNQTISVDWTLGEPVDEFMLDNNSSFSNGFQQSFDLIDKCNGNCYFITGLVHTGGNLLHDGTVQLIDSTYAVVDSMTVLNGYFKFEQLLPGKFTLLATPMRQETTLYRPTYYVNKLTAKTANQIPLNTDIADVDINLVSIVADIQTLEFRSFSMQVYPNPVKELLHILVNNTKPGKAEITIYNINGTNVYQNFHLISNNPILINLQNLPQGMYFIRLKSDENDVLFQKISILK
jgi:hypothetical protein